MRHPYCRRARRRAPVRAILVASVCTSLTAGVPVLAQGAAAAGVSPAANPAISVNALFLGAWTSAEDGTADADPAAGDVSGLRLQELEVQFASFVDPYWKADLILALPGGEGVEVEEGYVTSLGLPGGLRLKAGKFYAALGRQNLLHTHAYAFLDPPLANARLLGGEGLNEAGVSVDWLAPLPWFVELTGQVLDGANERFASDDGTDLLYLGHARSFHELGDAATLEWGASAAAGAEAFGGTASLLGADLTLKWRPLGAATRRAFVWQAEYLRADDDRPGVAAEAGLYTQAQWQFARRWWAEGRYDWLDPAGPGGSDWRTSALVALVPSEFSALRLQYSRLHEGGDDIDQVLLQLNVTIGSHPAHRY